MTPVAALLTLALTCPAGHHFRAALARAVDGDTYDVAVEVPDFRARFDDRLRLYGVDTPELHAKTPGERARAVRATLYAAERLRDGFTICTRGRDSFGRLLADVETADARDLAAELVEMALAEVFHP